MKQNIVKLKEKRGSCRMRGGNLFSPKKRTMLGAKV